ncbi:MAG: hypothetical protein OEV08_05100 [Nitrospira sp.]|nr:hypothetical protein [Nitrospira sp.]
MTLNKRILARVELAKQPVSIAAHVRAELGEAARRIDEFPDEYKDKLGGYVSKQILLNYLKERQK